MLRFCSSKIPSKNPTPDSALWPMSQEKKPSPFLERPEGEKTAFSPLKFADFFLPMHRTDSSCPSVSVSFFLWFQKKKSPSKPIFFWGRILILPRHRCIFERWSVHHRDHTSPPSGMGDWWSGNEDGGFESLEWNLKRPLVCYKQVFGFRRFDPFSSDLNVTEL